MSCDFCGTDIKVNWTQGAAPSCPNCGAILQISDNIVLDDPLQEVPVGGGGGRPRIGKVFGIIGILLGTHFALSMCVSLVSKTSLQDKLESLYPETTVVSSETNDDVIYVEELGRECAWNDEYESYYDKESDCYFYFDDSSTIGEWEYWYEGISSDFGDYGWMNYDYDECQWYIETSDGNWEKLPDRYDASKLWHFIETGTGKYAEITELYVEEIGRTCEWIPEESAYYDFETDCYFYYNDYVEPATWKFWYEDISNDYANTNGGWMEYVLEENCWYIEVSAGNWEALPDSYDTTTLWHIESLE